MRILVVSYLFPPLNTAGSLRAYSFARHWSRAGAEVTVLTSRKREDQRGFDVDLSGFELVELPVPWPRFLERWRRDARAGVSESDAGVSPGSASAPARAGASASRGPRALALRLLRRVKERTGILSSVRMPDPSDLWTRAARSWIRGAPSFDVVVSSSGPYACHLVARALKRAGKARRWSADFRDLWTQNASYRGLPPFTWIERRLERGCLREADLVSTVSDALAEELRRSTETPVQTIYNGHEPELTCALSSERAFPDDGCFRLVYTGAVYPAGQRPELLVQAIAALARERPDGIERLRLVVAGPHGALWRRLMRDHRLEPRLELRGEVSREEALRLQRDADLLVLLDWRDPARGVLTSKLFEYLAGSAPILVVGGDPSSAVGSLVARARRGVHAGDSIDGTLAALRAALDDSSEAIRTDGDRDDTFIATFTRERQAARYLEALRALG